MQKKDMKTKDFSGIRNNGSLPNPQDVEIPDDIGDLLEDYVESIGSMLNQIEKAALVYEAGNKTEENSANIKRILHKIKGESSMVGFEDISDLFHQAESAWEELDEDKRPDMLLRLRDWTNAAIQHMSEQL